jgi:hypothetical protein
MWRARLAAAAETIFQGVECHHGVQSAVSFARNLPIVRADSQAKLPLLQ